MTFHLPKPTATATALLAIGIMAAGVAAVDVSFWTHATREDYAEARLENVVVTNYGIVRLARSTQPLSTNLGHAGGAYAATPLAEGELAIGTGPEGMLLISPADDADEVRRIPVEALSHIFAIHELSPGRLLVGGIARNPQDEQGAALVEIDLGGDEPTFTPRLTADQAAYVWEIKASPAGDLYVAGGTPAQVFRLPEEANEGAETVFEAPGEENALSIAFDNDGHLLVGTTPGGLVWQVGEEGQTRVLFDAPEPDVVKLLVSGDTLYAAASAEAGMREEAEAAAGRPDVRLPGVPLEVDRGELPEAPDLPPVAPDRIPLAPGDEAAPPPAEEAQEAPPGEAPDEEGPGDVEVEDVPDPFADEAGPATLPGGFEAPTEAAAGSAIYRIDIARARAGTVTGVLQDPGTLFDMTRDGDRLILAAGPALEEGATSRVFAFDIATGETALLTTPPGGVAAVLARGSGPEGGILIGTVGPAGLLRLEDGMAEEGTLTSAPLDAGAVSRFGTVQLTGMLPPTSELLLSVRTGNAGDPEENPGAWSEWSDPVPARQYLSPDAPPARFFQYRLILRSQGTATAEVERIRVAYQLPNLPPRVTAVEVASELTGQEIPAIAEAALQAQQAPSAVRAVRWEAEDPNEDDLLFDLYFRKGRKGEFSLLAANLDDPSYAWDTKATGEGLYELKVVARDAADNPPDEGLSASRVSEPVLVDLTPPRIGDVQIEQEEGEEGGLVVTLRAADTRGIVARLEYQVAGTAVAAAADPASAEEWNRLFPTDRMSDSPQERYRLVLPQEAAGATLRLRAVDESGNLAYTSVVLDTADE